MRFSLFEYFELNNTPFAGLKKSTRPLVLTSASGCWASENLDDFQCKLTFFPYMPIIFVMQGKCLFQDISRPAFGQLVYCSVIRLSHFPKDHISGKFLIWLVGYFPDQKFY